MKKLIVAVLIIILFFYMIVYLGADNFVVSVNWDYYPDYGSKDVKYLVVFWNKYGVDSSFVGSGSVNGISYQDTTVNIVLQKGYFYRIWMVAVDSTDLMSTGSDTVCFELLPPVKIRGVKIKK